MFQTYYFRLKLILMMNKFLPKSISDIYENYEGYSYTNTSTLNIIQKNVKCIIYNNIVSQILDWLSSNPSISNLYGISKEYHNKYNNYDYYIKKIKLSNYIITSFFNSVINEMKDDVICVSIDTIYIKGDKIPEIELNNTILDIEYLLIGEDDKIIFYNNNEFESIGYSDESLEEMKSLFFKVKREDKINNILD